MKKKLNFDERVYDISENGHFIKMKPEVAEIYKLRLKEQLDLWVKGISKHTENLPEGLGVECCPDFSCCFPELLWPAEKRELFAIASEEERSDMLMGSLTTLTARVSEEKGIGIYVAGETDARNTH